MLDGYEVNAHGQLDRLLLIRAKRRKLKSDREYDPTAGKYLDKEKRFYPIRGDVFVLRYEEVKSFY